MEQLTFRFQRMSPRALGLSVFINSLIFFIVTGSTYLWNGNPDLLIALGPLMFILGTGIVCFLIAINGAALSPLMWFTLGCGLFFGGGALAEILGLNPMSLRHFGADLGYVKRANILNATSVMLASGFALLLHWKSKKSRETTILSTEARTRLTRLFPYLLVFSAILILSKYMTFPVVENLVWRSLFSKFSMFSLAYVLIAGMIWRDLDRKKKTLILIMLGADIFYGFVACSKFEVLSPLVGLILGLCMWNRRLRFILFSSTIMFLLVFVSSVIISFSRAHFDYSANDNSVGDRIEILKNVALSTVGIQNGFDTNVVQEGVGKVRKKFSVEKNIKFSNQGAVQVRRLALVGVQGYLMGEYDSGRRGKTLDAFWETFIPRIFWPEKPVITNVGIQLHQQYYKSPGQTQSSLGPSFNAEAYWNFGVNGMLLASVLYGLAIGWLTNYYFLALRGRRVEYFLIALPIVFNSFFVERWLVANILAQFVIFAMVLMVLRLIFSSQLVKRSLGKVI